MARDGEPTRAAIAAAARENIDALTVLYLRCGPAVENAIRFRVRRRPPQFDVDLSDAMTSAFFEVYDDIREGKFDATRSDAGVRDLWATITRRMLFSIWRRRRAKVRGGDRTIESLGDGAHAEPVASIESPSSAVRLAELRDVVRRAAEALPSDQQRVFTMVVFEDLTNQEVAQRLGKSANSIGATLHRARRRVQLAVEQWRRDQGPIAGAER